MGGSKTGIMAVDDQTTSLKIIENILNDDIELFFAMTGKECLDNLAVFNPSLFF